MQGLMQTYPLTIPHLFRRAESLFGRKHIHSVSHAGSSDTTYADWALATRRLGGALDSLGVSDGGRVGTFCWNHARHLELYFAVPCTGRVLHTLNFRLFAEQLVYIINHAEDEVIFCDRSMLAQLWPLMSELSTVRTVVVIDDGAGEMPNDPRIVDYDELVAACDPVEFSVADENRAAAMCYTSGTTGNPKGVVYSHRSVVLHSMSACMVDTKGLREADVLLPVVPMFHANAWGMPHAGVFCGADFVMPGPDLSPRAIADLIVDHKVTFTAGVPTIWQGCLPLLEGRDTSSLRGIVCGGSAVPVALSEAYRARLGFPLTQAWGMTETSPIAAVCNIPRDQHGRPDDELVALRAHVGPIAPLVEVRVVEPNTVNPIAWDGEQTGELQVRGPYIAREYYNDPRSPESFTADGWLRTGDVAAVNEIGFVRLVDRTKDLVKSGGEWISSVEVENELMAHPAVLEAAVVGVPHPRWDERPIACVVLRPGADASRGEILEFLTPRMAKWWLPDDVVFIDEVPKTSVGKFDKKVLRARFAEHELPGV